ncbi:ribonuclease P 40kDa subunit-domain-containing protein [Lentinula guzmanii]|uniref:Ribonuclease P 40kDa subunit-domain-containing protein n=1 Tax=Lentinula guzmanii TaxID=2804957 RepID=A0AA38JS38_9AGAR|nr:ribonuclease P 40kDa subunit-domain-containing protein [Lentinula guzmanii]
MSCGGNLVMLFFALVLDVVSSGLSLLSAGSGPVLSVREEDVWCIDHRGVLTLSVCKETYEGLGLVGKRVASGKGKAKQGDGRHVISIPLYAKEAESAKVWVQREAAVKRWEERRVREMGSSSWNVLVFSESISAEDLKTDLEILIKDSKNVDSLNITPVRCQKNVLQDVHIPVVRLTPRPRCQSPSEEEEEEDWCETMQGLFEWVGMAGFGSTRLKANDRIDPFVAVYEPPWPTHVGSVTHIQWTGFIRPSFVQSLIDLISHHLAQSPQAECPQFLSISSHACTWAPVAYISAKTQSQMGTTGTTPLRDLTREVEDSWCLIATASLHKESPRTVNSEKMCAWVLAEYGEK